MMGRRREEGGEGVVGGEVFLDRLGTGWHMIDEIRLHSVHGEAFSYFWIFFGWMGYGYLLGQASKFGSGADNSDGRTDFMMSWLWSFYEKI